MMHVHDPTLLKFMKIAKDEVKIFDQFSNWWIMNNDVNVQQEYSEFLTDHCIFGSCKHPYHVVFTELALKYWHYRNFLGKMLKNRSAKLNFPNQEKYFPSESHFEFFLLDRGTIRSINSQNFVTISQKLRLVDWHPCWT
jgi:hypothetical protein